MDRRLAVLPGLYLEANFKGGGSVRDRILCADQAAGRILRHRECVMPRRSTPAPRLGGVQHIASVPVTIR